MNKNAWVLTCNTLALGNEKKGLTLPPFFDTDLLSSRTSVKKGGRVAPFFWPSLKTKTQPDIFDLSSTYLQ